MRDRTTAEKLEFGDRVAVVTGGAQGIGQGICEGFAALGADVVPVDVNREKAEETAATLREEYDASARAVQTDVSDYEQARSMVETVVDEFGRLDVLVNNAGVGLNEPFAETTPDDWEPIVDVCYRGTLNCSHAALEQMTDQESTASIVNFASDSYKGNDPGFAVYGSAKAANVSFTKTLAKEVGEDGVRVNCISPGTTDTPVTSDFIDQHEDAILESYALDRLGEPEDIADGVVFLASDAADWITGQVLCVNGGYIRG